MKIADVASASGMDIDAVPSAVASIPKISSPKGKEKQQENNAAGSPQRDRRDQPKPKGKNADHSDGKPAVRELRTSRGTNAMTPPPSTPSTIVSLVPRTGPLLPSPKASLRPIQVPAVDAPGTGRQSRSEQLADSKSSRSISASAPVPAGTSGRTEEDTCVPCVELRGEVPVGSTALVAVSQSQCSGGGSRRPYEQWNIARYLVAPHNSRKLFWERAADHKRSEVAFELSRLPERHEVIQEARLDFGAEKWGLAAGRAPQINIDDDIEDDSDDGVI